MWGTVHPELESFSEIVKADARPLSQKADQQPPRLIQYAPWGKRIDRVETSSEWTELNKFAVRHQLLALSAEKPYDDRTRLYHFAKILLFHCDSSFVTCPIAMTDGAFHVVEQHAPKELAQKLKPLLTSKDPARFWMSGQWMTERQGGSDLSQCLVKATPLSATEWSLSGQKWFASAITSEMALVLAQISGDDSPSLFFLELKKASGDWNGLTVDRVKEKLGTRTLPTAEITLKDAQAVLVGPRGRGIKTASQLLNITRLHNAACSVGTMTFCSALIEEHSNQRSAFGKLISEHPGHIQMVATLRARLAASTELLCEAALLLGRVESQTAPPQDAQRLRLLTPMLKLFTAREATRFASETIETFGGQGYIEDTGVPKLLRDAQVFSIWEGTTNVLALDLLRATQVEGSFVALISDLQERLRGVPQSLTRGRIERRLATLSHYFRKVIALNDEKSHFAAAEFAWVLCETTAAVYLIERSTRSELFRLAAQRFVRDIGEWIPRSDDVGHLQPQEIRDLAFNHPLI